MTFDDETERVRGRTPLVAVPSASLTVIEGPSRGARAVLRGGVLRVGSAEGSALRLDDRRVSRVHCELGVSGSSLVLRDLGSTNGTFVEGLRVRDADLVPGAVVRVGDSAFRVEVDASPAMVAVSSHDAFGELLGGSLAMRLLYATLERAAPSDATVLVLGETGTGKDVVARSLHAASKRRQGPFVPVDCGAIPEHLIESELFGHVRGSFTGAVSNRKGAFEEAAGGTLFLDEIGEMPLPMQPKLLRAIETRSVRRVGADKPTPVDVRIVAATNRTLAAAVNQGLFREDLYYRLAVIEVDLPPLRARLEDVPILAAHFYERFAGAGKQLSPDFLAMLKARSWPGNVRELRNYLERAVTLDLASAGEGTPAAPGPLPQGIDGLIPVHLPLKEARDTWMSAFESVYVRAVLARAGGNVTRAAEQAGVSRRFLQRTLARLGLGAASDESADE